MTINTKKVQWGDIKAGDLRRRIELGKVLREEWDSGKSLRDIADERGLSHTQVRHLIELAEEDTREQELGKRGKVKDKVTA